MKTFVLVSLLCLTIFSGSDYAQAGAAVNQLQKAGKIDPVEADLSTTRGAAMLVIVGQEVSNQAVTRLVGILMLVFVNWFGVWIFRTCFVGSNVVKSKSGTLWNRQIQYQQRPALFDDWSVTDKGVLMFFYFMVLIGANLLIVGKCILEIEI